MRESKIEEFFARLKKAFEDADEVRRRASTVATQCGQQRLTAQLREQLDDRLTMAGIVTRPRFTDPGVSPRSWVTFLRPDVAQEIPFAFDRESQLSEFLVHNYKKIPTFQGLRLVGAEHPVGSGRCDLLFSKGKQRVVIELKVRAAARGTVEQLLEYAGHLKSEGYQVEAWVLATGARDGAVELLQREGERLGVGTRWLSYGVIMQLTALESSDWA